jgi:hypothetical protein
VLSDLDVDYTTYMQHIELVMDKGIRDYSLIVGKRGSAQYPAGYIYAMSLVRLLCKNSIKRAQMLFAVISVGQLYLVMLIYQLCQVLASPRCC